MANPFFSGRIPNELNERVNEFIKESGKTKTDILIEALAQYLNFPVEVRKPVGDSEELWKSIKELQERVAQLELGASKSSVIKNDNYDNNNNLIDDIVADNNSKIGDNKSDNTETESSEDIVIASDNNDNKEEESNEGIVIINDNHDNKEAIESQPIEIKTELPEFKEIITAEVARITNLSRKQVDYLMSKAIEKIKQQGKAIKPGELLEEPFEVLNKSGIEVSKNPYRLFYAGENIKEKAVWNLIPDNDNFSYQPVITELAYINTTSDNGRYQEDNNITHQEGNG